MPFQFWIFEVMYETNFEYYKIDLGQIWEYEIGYYFKHRDNIEFISKLQERYVDLILQTKKWQLKQNNGEVEKGLIIEPITSPRHYDRGENEYFIKILNEYQACQSQEDFLRISFFANKDEFYDYSQTIFASPLLSDFELWFALKLRQYSNGLKYVGEFCEFNLKHLYDNDYHEFKKVLNIILLQYKGELIDETVAKFVYSWINNFESESLVDLRKFPKKEWLSQTFMDDNFFLVNENIEHNDLLPPEANSIQELKNLEEVRRDHNEVNKNLSTSYRTYFLSALRSNRSILERKGETFIELTSIFKAFNEFVFSDDTSYDQFESLFLEGQIEPQNKIIWVGTWHQLYWLIKCIEHANICDHIGGNNKWIIAQHCFRYKVGRGKNKGEVIDIVTYKKISDASGKESENTDKLKQLVDRLKLICNGTPIGEKK